MVTYSYSTIPIAQNILILCLSSCNKNKFNNLMVVAVLGARYQIINILRETATNQLASKDYLT